MADPKKPRPAPPIDDVRKNKATLEKHDKGPSVKEVQKKLASKGYKVGWDGDFGDNTEAAVKAFQQASKIEPSGKVDAATLKAIEAPPPPPAKGNLASPWLKKLATGHLDSQDPKEKGHWCVRVTLANMVNLKVPNFSGNSQDKNNPRGAMVMLIKTGKWTSWQIPGSKLEVIWGMDGVVQVYAINADPFETMAKKKGAVPSGALIFQTRTGWEHGWEPDEGSTGNDMGILRDKPGGGMYTHNYQENIGTIIYPKCLEVVVLVPT
jgi:hypothetical protein